MRFTKRLIKFLPPVDSRAGILMKESTGVQKACLVVIDGWGLSSDDSTSLDAIKVASTPAMTRLMQTHQFIPLVAHGLAVGLPSGLMGNSEVGHLNIGAGRVVYQDIVRIDEMIETGAMAKNETIIKAIECAKNGTGRIHLIGLVFLSFVLMVTMYVFRFLMAEFIVTLAIYSPY